jgi:hypothetical protein
VKNGFAFLRSLAHCDVVHHYQSIDAIELEIEDKLLLCPPRHFGVRPCSLFSDIEIFSSSRLSSASFSELHNKLLPRPFDPLMRQRGELFLRKKHENLITTSSSNYCLGLQQAKRA